MTSKLKCPVCNHELYQTASECLTYCCLNKDCPSDFKFAGSKEIWNALIQAKQDLEQSEKCCSAWETQALDYKAETIALSGKLEIAQKALKGTVAYYDHYADFDGEISWDGVAMIMRNDAAEALEQIEHKEK